MFTFRTRLLFLVFFACAVRPVYGTQKASRLKIQGSRFSIPSSAEYTSMKGEEIAGVHHLTDIVCQFCNSQLGPVPYKLYDSNVDSEQLDILATDTDTEE